MSFLTVLRIRPKDFDGRMSVYSFVLVGLTIGLPPFLFVRYMPGYVPRTVEGIIVMMYYVIITGALHLDGLADTADGIFSGRSREKMLEIMKDSRIGTMGAVSIGMVLITKSFTIYSINNPMYFLLVPAYARFSMVFGVYGFHYARENGTAAAFFGNYSWRVFAQGIILVLLSYIISFRAFIMLNVMFAIFLFYIMRLYKKRIGGITGDMLGAMCESCEAVLFLTAVFL